MLFVFAIPCAAEQPAATSYTANTKIKVDAGTPAEGDACLKTAQQFLVLWNDGKLEEAAELVEPRLRKTFLEELQKKPIKLQSIDEVRIFTGLKKTPVLGGVRFSRDPKPGRTDLKKSLSEIDMILIDGKWWITAR